MSIHEGVAEPRGFHLIRAFTPRRGRARPQRGGHPGRVFPATGRYSAVRSPPNCAIAAHVDVGRLSSRIDMRRRRSRVQAPRSLPLQPMSPRLGPREDRGSSSIPSMIAAVVVEVTGMVLMRTRRPRTSARPLTPSSERTTETGHEELAVLAYPCRAKICWLSREGGRAPGPLCTHGQVPA